MAVGEAGRLTGAAPVAGASRVQLAARAGGQLAHGVPWVLRAAAHAVAGARVPTARLAFVDALAPRVGQTLIDGPAAPESQGEVAGDARALAGDVAADPVGTEPRLAVVVDLAGHPLHALAATAAHAGMSGRALSVVAAAVETAAGRGIAGEGNADDGRAGLALPESVARPPLMIASPSQLPALHCVPATYFRQLPRPSHFPSSPQVAGSEDVARIPFAGPPAWRRRGAGCRFPRTRSRRRSGRLRCRRWRSRRRRRRSRSRTRRRRRTARRALAPVTAGRLHRWRRPSGSPSRRLPGLSGRSPRDRRRRRDCWHSILCSAAAAMTASEQSRQSPRPGPARPPLGPESELCVAPRCGSTVSEGRAGPHWR